MSGSDKLFKLADSDAAMVADLRYFPMLVFAWHGAATEAMINEYFAHRARLFERATEENTKVVLITDMTNFKPPPATIRKSIGEQAKEQDVVDSMHMYFTVVPSALLRGVVTAMQWIGGSQIKPNKNVASIQEAVQLSLAEYEKLNITPPSVDPATYVVPMPDDI